MRSITKTTSSPSTSRDTSTQTTSTAQSLPTEVTITKVDTNFTNEEVIGGKDFSSYLTSTATPDLKELENQTTGENKTVEAVTKGTPIEQEIKSRLTEGIRVKEKSIIL